MGAIPRACLASSSHKATLSTAGFRQLMSCWISWPGQALSRASFVRFRQQSRKALPLGGRHAESPKRTAEQNAALVSSRGHLGLSPAAAVAFSTQPCRAQNRGRHPRRMEPLPEMSGLGVLPWQEGQSALTGLAISHAPINRQSLLRHPVSAAAQSACRAFWMVFKRGK